MNPIRHHPRAAANLRILIVGLGILGVGVAIFLSVKSSPSMSVVRWLPKFITNWADHHGQLCNLPAYALLATPFLALGPGRSVRLRVVASISMLIVLLEFVQIWIPSRNPDLWDIFWGCSGVMLSWAALEAGKMFSRGSSG